MWCLIQVEEGVVDFDYFALADEYLDLASSQPAARGRPQE
jgi:hypothetical protein